MDKKGPDTAGFNRAFGAFLRSRRESAGVTAAQLAEKLGMTRQAFHLLESGRNGMRASTAYYVADALGMTLGQFVEGFSLSPPAVRRKKGGAGK